MELGSLDPTRYNRNREEEPAMTNHPPPRKSSAGRKRATSKFSRLHPVPLSDTTSSPRSTSSLRRGPHQLHILREHSNLVFGRRLHPLRSPGRNLVIAQS